MARAGTVLACIIVAAQGGMVVLGVWQCSEGHGIKSPFSPKFFVLAR